MGAATGRDSPMRKFTDLLTRKSATAAELRRALAEVPITESVAAVQRIEATRRAMLLKDEGAAALDKIERELVVAVRARDTNAILAEELTGKLGEAEERERRASIEAKRDAADQAAAAVATAFEERYAAAVFEIIGLFDRLQAAEMAVADANRAMVLEGLAGHVPDVRGRMILSLPFHHGERLRAGLAADNLDPGYAP